ncbi:MAG: hypothetical protein PHR81_08270 [Bacteroidales bacterium]|jgi:hypothetical protein|nr:FUSC family protein [Bacteroidales bacterium]MDD4214789.1 hypothetical protein [Bacteroidales bacterium]
MKIKIKSSIKIILYFILTALILCIPALYNRYVLFYTDSALYLESAMTLAPSLDRPIGYGFFIRATTWQTSLWYAIFMQGMIASLLIYHSLKTVLVHIGFKKIYHFLTLCILVIFSTLGWYTSLLMPDVLTSFLILAVFNVIFGKNNIITYILYSTLLFFIIFSHLSNFPILLMILATLWLFILLKKTFASYRKKTLYRTLLVLIVFLGTITYLIKYNYDHYGKATISPTSGVFTFARLIDTGVIDIYLRDNYDKKNYQICQFKDDIPSSSQMFLWDLNGIFYKMGGWANYQEEPKIIVNNIFKSPKYYGTIVKDFSLSTLKQLLEFKVGDDLLNFTSESWRSVYDKIIQCYPKKEIKHEFCTSKQSKEEFKFDTLNDVILLFVVLSLILIAFIVSRYKIHDKIYLFLVVNLSGVIFNAAVCANLSNVLNRYQARVVWIIPFIAIVLFLNYILPRLISYIRK